MLASKYRHKIILLSHAFKTLFSVMLLFIQPHFVLGTASRISGVIVYSICKSYSPKDFQKREPTDSDFPS